MSVRKIARGWAAGLALSAALSVALPALAAPERVALVIGNAAYQHASRLANPLNDAADVAAALERVGFSVTSLTDAGKQELERGLQAFRRKAAAAKIAAVFYAGHGIEVDKHNYLVPVDARLQTDGDVKYETVSLDLVMETVEGAKEFRLVVLDACRENPFLASMRREAGSTRSIGRGLARAEPTGGGTLLAYSAKEGTVAADGSGRNSPYTEALLRYLEEPGLEVGLMFRKVRDAVVESTGQAQEPFAYGSLSAKGAYFIPPVGPPDPTDETPGGGAVADGPGMELEYWKSVNAIEDPGAKVAALLAYRERFSEGVYASLADIQLKALRATPAGSGGAEERSPSAGETNLRLTREELRGIQRALAQAGYDPGPADGIIGRGTRGAIGRWQRAQGRSATGYLGPEDAKALLALAPVPDPAVAVPLPPTPPLPSPTRPTDPSQVVLASGRLLSDWMLLSEDRLASGEYRTLLVEGAGHLRKHGRFASVESVVERALEGLVEGLRVTNEASARAALRSVEQIRDVAGERAALTQVEARASLRLGRFDEAVLSYRKWLRLAGPGHPERREMLAGLRKAEKRERLPQAGERFRDCDEAWCPEMVVVPAGSFMMGSPASEEARDDDEGPRHRVRIAKPLAVGVYEVTRRQFAAFVGATDHDAGNRCQAYEGGSWEWLEGLSWRNPGFDQTDAHPVVCVRWEDAQAYVDWLGEKTGEAYRLLSESEWEYVARAGTQTSRYWGESVSGQCRHGNGADGSLKRHYSDWEWATVGCDDGEVHTAPVGQFKANRFGLHDVHGNVWEWVEDCWNGSYAGAPTDGSAWRSGDCSQRVLRGGSWYSYPGFLRAAVRNGVVTGVRSGFIGFRIARTLD